MGFEQSHHFPHPQRMWSSYTNIDQGKPTGCTHTVETGVWVSIFQQAHVIEVHLGCLAHRCQLWWLCGAVPAPRWARQTCHTVGHSGFGSVHLRRWSPEARGKMQGQCLCVSLYIDICQIHMCMGIWICIYIVDVYTHTHAQKHINLKQNSSGPWVKEGIWTYKTFWSIWWWGERTK